MKYLLVINAGSSSLKFAIFRLPLQDDTPAICRGQVNDIGKAPHLRIRNAMGESLLDAAVETLPGASPEEHHDASLHAAMTWLAAQQLTLAGVGHRVVHGGDKFRAPLLLDAARMREQLDEIAVLSPLAPLHQPHNLRPIHAVAKRMPGVPQVVCFDTAFHQTQSALAQRYALPRALSDSGIKRYGFHGLSYEYIACQLPAIIGHRAHGAVVVAHLGNGASMCGMHDLKSVATSTGFSTIDGLVMGTRPGATDPGVLLYLLQHCGYDADKLSHLLYHESGLLGVSGISQDMRTLEASESAHADEAIELFCYRAAREVGSLAVALGGLDALVFTGGIGENSSRVRMCITQKLAWMGVRTDESANRRKHGMAFRIDAGESSVALAVVPANEEWMIAHHTSRSIHANRHASE